MARGRQLLSADGQHATREFLEDAVGKFPENPEIWILLASVALEIQPEKVASYAARRRN